VIERVLMTRSVNKKIIVDYVKLSTELFHTILVGILKALDSLNIKENLDTFMN